MTIDQAMQIGIAHHSRGNLGDAEISYRQVLAASPDHPDALHLLGLVAYQVGKHAKAESFVRQAIALRPKEFPYHINLGVVLAAMGRGDEAITEFQAAAALSPTTPEPLNLLGRALFDSGKSAEALKYFDRALELRNEFPDALHNRGDALQALGRRAEAIESYRRALVARPNSPMTQLRLADAYMAGGEFAQAVELYRTVLAATTHFPDAWNNLGHCLISLGRLGEASDALGRCLAIEPDHHLALNNMGNVMFHQGKMREAAELYRKSIDARADYPDAHNNLGNALWGLGEMDESFAQFDKAIALRPNYVNAMSNLAGNLKDVGRIEEAIGWYKKILEIAPDNAGLHSNYIYAMNFDPDATPEIILAEQTLWDERHRREHAAHSRARGRNGRIRIGYISADFREHVLAANLIPILENHDRSAFEIFCYSNVLHPDARTEAIKTLVDHWRSIAGVNDADADALIRNDGIDILIDLSLHSSGNRLPLFSRKPAPVQMCYLGYCGATGLSSIDYRISDRFIDEPATEKYYREKTLYLPNCYWCYRPGGPSPEPRLPGKDFITFGSLNNFAKISRPAIALWMRILDRLPDARLLLYSKPGRHLDVLDHPSVEFVGRQYWQQYIETYSRIDIALDPFPHNGGITTCDALWMGTPVVTLAGNTSVGRAGKSILSHVGLSDLVAHSPEEYIDIAVGLAKGRAKLRSLRGSLRQRMMKSPLMDYGGFTRDLENLCRQALNFS